MDLTEQVKCAQLDLVMELDRICRKHNISYFLTGGTLIGAIRHNGFIPWDDDLDVALLRKDYDRLMEVLKTELDPAYYVHDWYTDPASPLPYCKLRIRGTHYTETVSQKAKCDDGIFIDLFPFDPAPGDPAVRRRQARQIYFLRRVLMVRAGYVLDKGSTVKRLVYSFLKLFSYCRSMESWKEQFKKVSKMGTEDSGLVISTCGAYSYERELKPSDMLDAVTEHIFEGKMLFIPEKYDEFLRSYYGDYMQLPPEEQRVGIHGVLNIDFGDYQIRNQLMN